MISVNLDGHIVGRWIHKELKCAVSITQRTNWGNNVTHLVRKLGVLVQTELQAAVYVAMKHSFIGHIYWAYAVRGIIFFRYFSV